MAESTPYNQLVGPVKFYLAPYGTAEPAVNTTPSSPWVELGSTDGEQTFTQEGDLTFFRDNDHQGPVKAVRPEEDATWTATLVNMTHALVARVVSSVSRVTTAAGPPATSKLPNKRGYIPSEYAILAKGLADSPYGNYPGQNYIPRGVFDTSPEITRGKENRAEMEFTFTALEDDAQSENDKLGWGTAQTS